MIEVTYDTTVVVGKSICEKLAAVAVHDAQMVSLDEFLTSMESRELSPNLVVLHNVSTDETAAYLTAARNARKLGYQKIYLRQGIDTDGWSGSHHEPIELETGIYSWRAPFIPAKINFGECMYLMNIVCKYEREDYVCEEISHNMAKNFITECECMPDVLMLRRISIINWEETMGRIAASGSGRIDERRRFAKYLCNFFIFQ